MGVKMNARGGIEKRPVTAAKCIKQNLLLPHIRSGLGSNRLRPAFWVRLQLLCHGRTKLSTGPMDRNSTGHRPSHHLYAPPEAGELGNSVGTPRQA
jgi:hypothetical protein